MSVKKEASGRRSVQVEVEVPGTPEEVWQAIATGPGISSWFVPTEFEERDGKPVAVKLNFGPGMESRSVVTAWDPPRMFAGRGERSGGLGTPGRRSGEGRRGARGALGRPGGRPGAQRRRGARQPESVQRPVAARQAGARHRRPGRRQLRRPDHGDAQLLPLR